MQLKYIIKLLVFNSFVRLYNFYFIGKTIENKSFRGKQKLLFEIIKLIVYSSLIVLISKFVLVETLRKLAENLDLEAKTVGNIAGISTSIPEFLTITTSTLRGLAGVSIYNIFSSNVINFIQYLAAIYLNKNTNKLKNKAIKIDLILVGITIIIPILLLKQSRESRLSIVPLYIILYVFFRYLNHNVHKLYLQKEDDEIEEEIEEESKSEKKNINKTVKHILILLISGFFLYFVGELLGNSMESLCQMFEIPEIILGIILGFVTSIPELITFLETQKHHKQIKNEWLGVVEATNNLLTSNMLNLFIIQTVGIMLINIKGK